MINPAKISSTKPFSYHKLSARAYRPGATDNSYLMVDEDVYEISKDLDQLIDRLPLSYKSMKRQANDGDYQEDLDSCIHYLREIGAIEVLPFFSFWRIKLTQFWRRCGGCLGIKFRKMLGVYPLVIRCVIIKEKLSRRASSSKYLRHQAAKRILLIIQGGIGDMILSTPMLCLLRRVYRGAVIDVITKAKYAGFFEGCPLVNQVIKWPGNSAVFGILGPPCQLLESIYRKYDITISCVEHFGGAYRWFTGKAISYLSEAPVRIGTLDGITRKYPRIARRFLTQGVEQRREHEARRMLKLLGPLGINNTREPARIWISRRDQRELDKIYPLKNASRTRKNLVGVSPFTVLPRQWPYERWSGLIDYLIEEEKATVVMLGARQNCDDAVFLVHMCKNKDKIVSLVGKTTLGSLGAVINLLSLLITHDSGPAHFAAALQVPEIVLFAWANPGRCGPWQNKASLVIRNPSLRIADIALAEVCQAARQMLEKGNKRPNLSH